MVLATSLPLSIYVVHALSVVRDLPFFQILFSPSPASYSHPLRPYLSEEEKKQDVNMNNSLITDTHTCTDLAGRDRLAG